MEKKEITLLDLLKLLYKALKKLILGILKALGFISRLNYRYFILIAITTALGFVLAYHYPLSRFERVDAEVTLRCVDGNRKNVEQAIQKFQRLTYDEKLSRTGLPINESKKLRYFEVVNCIDAQKNSSLDFFDYNNSVKMNDSSFTIFNDRIRLIIHAKGTRKFEPIKTAFLRFMTHDQALLRTDHIFRTIAQNKLKVYDHEINRLDSLSNVNYFEKNNRSYVIPSPGILVESESAQLIYSDLLGLHLQRDQIFESLESAPTAVHFENDITFHTTPKRTVWFYGLILGYIFGLLCALLWRYKKKIHQYLKKS